MPWWWGHHGSVSVALEFPCHPAHPWKLFLDCIVHPATERVSKGHFPSFCVDHGSVEPDLFDKFQATLDFLWVLYLDLSLNSAHCAHHWFSSWNNRDLSVFHFSTSLFLTFSVVCFYFLAMLLNSTGIRPKGLAIFQEQFSSQRKAESIFCL